MQEHELQKIIDGVKEVIDFTVNGNLVDIQRHLEKQDTAIKEIHVEQIGVKVELERLRIETNPLINDRKVITAVGKFVIWIGAIAITILSFLKLVR